MSHEHSHHAVAGSPGAPRAVFIGLLRMTPGGLTFSGYPLAFRMRLSTAAGLQAGGIPAFDHSHNARASALRPSDARQARRDQAAWTADGFVAPNLRHPHQPPLPAPASDDADQTPLVDGTG